MARPNTKTRNSFVDVINDIKNKNGDTIDTLSAKSGIPYSILARIINGRLIPTQEMLNTFIKVYALNKDSIAKLTNALIVSRKKFTIKPSTDNGKILAAYLENNIDKIPDEVITEINSIIKQNIDL